jgi:hypothetical protein
MKDASRYPVTTGYGYVAGYPVNNGFHRGEDRAMPVGTAVIVNGVTIGLSGNTGLSTGPHLHIGKFVGGVVQHPQGGGFSLPNASVFDTGEDKTSGKFVRVGSGGAVWIYAHLSQINVTKGQALTTMSPTRKPIPPALVAEHIANFTNGNTRPKATEPVCQNRFEDPQSDEFWYGLTFHLKDTIVSKDKQLAEARAEIQKLNARIRELSAQGEYIPVTQLFIKK